MGTCRVTHDTGFYLDKMDKDERDYQLLTSHYPINPETFRGFNVEKDFFSIEWALSNYPDLFDEWIMMEEDIVITKSQAFIDRLPFSVIEQFLYEYAEMHGYKKMAHDFLN